MASTPILLNPVRTLLPRRVHEPDHDGRPLVTLFLGGNAGAFPRGLVDRRLLVLREADGLLVCSSGCEPPCPAFATTSSWTSAGPLIPLSLAGSSAGGIQIGGRDWAPPVLGLVWVLRPCSARRHVDLAIRNARNERIEEGGAHG